MSVTLKNPKFQAKINGKWRDVLCINYHGYEPTLTFVSEPGSGWMLDENGDKRHFTMSGYQSGWPLKNTEIRIV